MRDYLPDDDVRQVNWRATARLGRPMSNQYRIEQDRDVMLVVDAGRLVGRAAAAAPAARGRPCSTPALDALTAVALVADEVGDRCGAVAFDDEVRFARRPGRAAARAVVRSLFDLSRGPSSPTTSSRSAASRAPSGRSCSCSATCSRRPPPARSSRRCRCSPAATRSSSPARRTRACDALAARAAGDRGRPRPRRGRRRGARRRDARRRAGARARAPRCSRRPPDRLPRACVAAYLRAKARARL